MPGGDRTGPTGQGPMTGGGYGYCGGAGQNDDARITFGRNLRRGGGRRGGNCNGFRARGFRGRNSSVLVNEGNFEGGKRELLDRINEMQNQIDLLKMKLTEEQTINTEPSST